MQGDFSRLKAGLSKSTNRVDGNIPQTNGQLMCFMEHASDHIMNSCLELDDIWDKAYEEATRTLMTCAQQFRKAAVQKGDWD